MDAKSPTSCPRLSLYAHSLLIRLPHSGWRADSSAGAHTGAGLVISLLKDPPPDLIVHPADGILFSASSPRAHGQALSLWNPPSPTSFPMDSWLCGQCYCHGSQPCGDMKCWEAWPLLGRLCIQKTTKPQQKLEGKDASVFHHWALEARLLKGATWKAARHLAGPGTQGPGLASLGTVESGAAQGMGDREDNRPCTWATQAAQVRRQDFSFKNKSKSQTSWGQRSINSEGVGASLWGLWPLGQSFSG